MKRFLMGLSILAIAVSLPAQKKPVLSPPAKATATIDGKAISITYSSPRVRGREGKIFSQGGLISHDPHYPVWRAGANSATTLHTDADLKIGDLSVPKGDYTLFVDLSNPDQWQLIVNKQTGEWGLKYDGSQDLGKTTMHMSKPPQMVEDLVWTIRDEGHGRGRITLSWEDHSASVPFTVH
ncbi:MAG: DUF2911 domain-containing protein [Acidobacteriaceae bacterium]